MIFRMSPIPSMRWQYPEKLKDHEKNIFFIEGHEWGYFNEEALHKNDFQN